MLKPLAVKSRRYLWMLGLLLAFGLLSAPRAWAQGKRRVVQFTGIVASGDSLLGVPGATVFVPKAGRGTTTNIYGFFSMPVLAGDSIEIRSLGYRSQHIIIPVDYTRQSFSVIITLKEDATILPEVRVFPYATEQEFKQAFLNLKLPTDRPSALADNLSSKNMQRIFNAMPVGPMVNYRQTMAQQQYSLDRRMGIAPNPQSNNPLLNPFSWLQLIKQVKDGEFKKKEGEDY